MFSEDRLIGFAMDDVNAHSFESQEPTTPEPEEDVDIAQSFMELSELEEIEASQDESAESISEVIANPVEQSDYSVTYQIESEGSFSDIEAQLRENMMNIFDEEPYYRIYDRDGQVIEASLFPDSDLALEPGYTIETSKYISEDAETFDSYLSLQELNPERPDLISYTVDNDTTLFDLVQSGVIHQLEGNFLSAGLSGNETRLRITDPDGNRIGLSNTDRIKSIPEDRLTSINIPAGSSIDTRLYGDFNFQESQTEAIANRFNYSAEDLQRYADIARSLPERQVGAMGIMDINTLNDAELIDAVADFQDRNDLEVDGIVGNQTLGAIQENIAQSEEIIAERREMLEPAAGYIEGLQNQGPESPPEQQQEEVSTAIPEQYLDEDGNLKLGGNIAGQS